MGGGPKYFDGQGNPIIDYHALGTPPSQMPGGQGPAAPAAAPAAPSTLDPSTALQPGTPIPGLPDMTKKGPGEQAYADHGQSLFDPSKGDAWWNQNSGALGNAMGGETFADKAVQGYQNNPGQYNNAQGAYADFKSSTPANTDPYFDNAANKLSDTMNSQLAARGTYGSSVGLNSLAGGMADLRGQQAMANAQYGLQRAQIGGGLAAGADRDALSATMGMGSLANQGEQDALARMGLGGNLALGITGSDTNRTTAGINAALGAQSAESTRGQNAFNNEFSVGDALSKIMGDGNAQMFGTDPGLMGQQTGLPITAANNDVVNSYRDEANRNGYIKNFVTGGTDLVDAVNKKKASSG